MAVFILVFINFVADFMHFLFVVEVEVEVEEEVEEEEVLQSSSYYYYNRVDSSLMRGEAYN